MTEENIRRNAKDEMRLAELALGAAQLLLDNGIVPDSASRAYYAALHAARALLFSVGVEPGSHQAVRSLISLHFVKPGLLSPAASKHLGHLESLRTSSDYDSAFALGRDEVQPEVDKARAFVEEVRGVLRAGGLLE